MRRAQGRARIWRALLAAIACAIALPAQAQAMEVMTEDNNTLSGPRGQWGYDYRTAAWQAAGWVGARYIRATVANKTGFSWEATDEFVADAQAKDFTPYLTINWAPADIVDGSQSGGQATVKPTDTSLPVPSVTEFGDFCESVALRYRGKVGHYSVMNEPNLFYWRTGPGSSIARRIPAAHYGDLFRECRARIVNARADSGAKVYFGELAAGSSGCNYVQNALPAGIVTVADGLAFHPYQWSVAPGQDTPYCSGVSSLSEWDGVVSGARSRFQTPGGGKVPLMITEFGYCVRGSVCESDLGPSTMDEQTRADWLEAAFRLVRDSGLVTFFSYYHLTDGHSRNWNTGIVDEHGNKSLAATRLRTVTGTQSPSAAADVATNLRETAATLNGTVDPNGAKTTYHFEYGRTTAYGSSTPARTLPAGDAPVAVDAAVSGLRPGTGYHVKLVVMSRTGDGVSAGSTFETPDRSRPAVLLPAAGGRYVYYRDADGTLRERGWDGRAWTATDLDIEVRGTPAAVEIDGMRFVYARGENGHLWQFVRTATGWTRWDMGFAAAGDPVVLTPANLIYVRGANGNLWQVSFQDGRWVHWDMGLAIDGDPAVIADYVYVRGANGSLWQVHWNGSDWTHWDMGVPMTDDPVALLSGPNRMIWVRGADGNLWQVNWTGTRWTHWPTGWEVQGTPALLGDQIYTRRGDGDVWQILWTGSDWSLWDMALAAEGDPAAATQLGKGYVYYRGANGNLWQAEWSGGLWTSWDMGA